MAGTTVRAPRQTRSQGRVDRILAATRELVLDQGASRMTMKAIARTADISMSSIYQYFPDKDAIVAELFRRFLVENGRRMDAALTPPPPDIDALLEICVDLLRDYLQMHRQDPALRDIRSAYAVGQAIRAIDQEDSLKNLDLIFDRATHLFAPEQKKDARRILTVLFTMSVAAIEMALQHDDAQANAIANETEAILRAAWRERLTPLQVIKSH